MQGSRFRTSMLMACDVERPFASAGKAPQVRTLVKRCSFVNYPVAYSSNALRTGGARWGSAYQLLPVARGAFQ